MGKRNVTGDVSWWVIIGAAPSPTVFKTTAVQQSPLVPAIRFYSGFVCLAIALPR